MKGTRRGGTPVERLGAAYYFWMASFAVLFVGTVYLGFTKKQVRVDAGPA